MNVADTCRAVVFDYPGGAESLAPRIGKAPSSLSHEVDPNYRGAKLGVLDAVAISQLSGDLRIVMAIALACDCYVMPLPKDVEANADLLPAMNRGIADLSAMFSEITSDASDGRINDNERAAIHRCAGKLIASVQAIVMVVDGMHTASKPVNLREVA